jgi:uncharacterized RDD family membrane protein YckC
MIQEALPHARSRNGEVENPSDHYSPKVESANTSTLIAFPGSRSVPEWRKQLSQRVREVQERKAREAAEELAAAQAAGLVSCALPSGQLELVPDLENPITNPIVTKALERLQRARRPEYSDAPSATAAVAPALTSETESFSPNEDFEAPVLEAKPKLTVVAPLPPAVEPLEQILMESVATTSLDVDPFTPEEESTLIESLVTEPQIDLKVELPTTAIHDRKPIRVITDNDIALSYLETCLSVPALAGDTREDIPGLTRRFFAGVLDLIMIALIASPAAAAVYYSGSHWSDPRIIGLLSGAVAVVMFVYLTMCTAMTGRTLGMRVFSMRTIDLRTGLIPSGGQSLARAFTYVFSFALLGLGLAYAIVDPDKRAVHDRVSKTIVIRV